MLPASGQLRQYIEHGEQLDVPRAPSVAQRGQAWWHEDWRRTQVAVQIHPGFLHQVWWSDEPFVAKNNFHILAFAPQVAQADRELIAASLASGWGALSALYISGEVGCEGVRWLSTSQFERWPVLNPEKVTRENRASVLQAYRLFRKLRAKEIQAMDVASMDAWLTLTQEVARAAGMSDPAGAARQCLDTARQVCVRRTQRESMALAGRVRKGRRDGSNLSKHVRARLKADPSAAAAVARLTGGDRQMELRVPKDIPQSSFDFGDTSSIAGETSLAETLGDGFACAPVIVNNDLEYLARELESLLTGLIVTLVGERPAEGDSALNTYIALGAEVRSITIKWLQHEVKRKLS